MPSVIQWQARKMKLAEAREVEEVGEDNKITEPEERYSDRHTLPSRPTLSLLYSIITYIVDALIRVVLAV